jgi:outer membrane murein-binding lipoprotein Lpp
MDELLSLLSDWGRYSLLEGDAVRASNWDEVLRLQQLKKDLQSRISVLPRGCSDAKVQKQIDTKVRELTEQTARLAEDLQQQKQAASLQQQQWHNTVGQLRKVRHVYRAEPHARWQSYS